jgi:1,2-diacylglycerol 3-beta-glucosyltransferase
VKGFFRSLVLAGEAAAVVASLPSMASGSYLGALTAMARPRRPLVGDRSVRFAVVIPAHNEALSITDTVASVLALDYPAGLRKVVVIADNCTDHTAQVAKDAGADVIERFDDQRRSKGYALTDVLPEVLRDPWVDAVVVVDADTIVQDNLLSCFAAHFAAGAQVVQADYAVANPDHGWRTELLDVAFTCFHEVRSLGREHLRLSSGLRGNGMGFTRRALELVPHHAASLVEDLEHGIALAEAGIRVVYAHDTRVWAEMPNNDEAAESQRRRWERGRELMRKQHGWSLLRSALERRDRVRGDLAVDVMLPPLTTVARNAVAAFGGAVVISLVKRRPSWALIPSALGVFGLTFHVATGWKRSSAGRRVLANVPQYLRWKAGLTSRPEHADNAWVRTKRNAEIAMTKSQNVETSHGHRHV